MRVAVTGSQGYVGSLVVPLLLEAGHEVRGIDVGLFDAATFDVGTGWSRAGGEQVVSHRLDVRDLRTEDLEGCDAVIHLAALSNDPLGDRDPALTEQINHRAAVRVAEAARQAGVHRFVLASTCSVYGAAGEAWLDEDSAVAPVTAYARSKLAAEIDVLALATPSFEPVALRPGTAYGASPRLRADLVVNNLVGWAHTTGEVRLLSDGSAWRPVVHVADIAAAFVAAATTGTSIGGRVLNVGSTAGNRRVRELADVIGATIDRPVVTAPEADADVRSYRVRCERIGAVLGWQPTVALQDGIAELVEAYERHGFDERDLHERFRRNATLDRLVASGELSPSLRWAAIRSTT